MSASPWADQDQLADQDHQVVRRVLAGNVDAFNVLVNRYQRQVYRLGLRFLRCREDAQDYAQDVFLKAYEHLQQFRCTGRFYSWLMGIAFNYGKDCVKKSRLPLEAGEPEPADPTIGPEGQVLKEIARGELYSAITRLPRNVATCLNLHYFQGFAYVEVGRITGIPCNTVKSHIRRAKRYLKVRLSGTAADTGTL